MNTGQIGHTSPTPLLHSEITRMSVWPGHNTGSTWQSNLLYRPPVPALHNMLQEAILWQLGWSICIHVDISTEVCTYSNSISILQWISQQPLMIKPRFNFSNIGPLSNEAHCIIRMYLPVYWKKLFISFGDCSHPYHVVKVESIKWGFSHFI